MSMYRYAMVVLLGTLCWLQPAAAAEKQFPLIQGYGGITPVPPQAKEHPERKLRYRVVFNVTQPSEAPDKPNRSLEKVAAFVNLLAADKVRPERGDVVAIVHGKATPLVLTEGTWGARHDGAANPNLELIRRLNDAGIEVHVCSQALAEQGIAPAEVDKSVQIDVSAMTTLTTLQLHGYALMPD